MCTTVSFTLKTNFGNDEHRAFDLGKTPHGFDLVDLFRLKAGGMYLVLEDQVGVSDSVSGGMCFSLKKIARGWKDKSDCVTSLYQGLGLGLGWAAPGTCRLCIGTGLC